MRVLSQKSKDRPRAADAAEHGGPDGIGTGATVSKGLPQEKKWCWPNEMALFLRGRDEGRKETVVLHKNAMTFD